MNLLKTNLNLDLMAMDTTFHVMLTKNSLVCHKIFYLKKKKKKKKKKKNFFFK